MSQPWHAHPFRWCLEHLIPGGEIRSSGETAGPAETSSPRVVSSPRGGPWEREGDLTDVRPFFGDGWLVPSPLPMGIYICTPEMRVIHTNEEWGEEPRQGEWGVFALASPIWQFYTGKIVGVRARGFLEAASVRFLPTVQHDIKGAVDNVVARGTARPEDRVAELAGKS